MKEGKKNFLKVTNNEIIIILGRKIQKQCILVVQLNLIIYESK